MDQRIAVHEFQRRRGRNGGSRRDSEQCGALDHQEGPQALAAGEHAVPHGRHQARRSDGLAVADVVGQQPLQLRLGEAGRVREALIEEGGVGHGGSGVTTGAPEP